jgi:hypothetical protein
VKGHLLKRSQAISFAQSSTKIVRTAYFMIGGNNESQSNNLTTCLATSISHLGFTLAQSRTKIAAS